MGRAERRTLAAFLALLAAAPALLALAPVAEAQASTDPWWGPADRSRPTEGWAVRVPITIENPRDYAIADAVALVDIDFGKLLVQAGWTNRTAGADVTLRGFRLDVDSIRVIEYGRGFSPGPIAGQATQPTPHIFYPAMLHASRTRDFDPERNPAGTLAFHIPGVLQPQERRFYYVYANPLEYEAAPMKPHAHLPETRAVLESFLWGTSGQTFYGYEPPQTGQTHFLRVLPLTPKPTRIEVFELSLGRFSPLQPTATYPNPATVTRTGMMPPETATFFVPAGRVWKVVADHPVTVMQHGRISTPPAAGGGAVESLPEWRGFVPSVTGSYAGSSFWVYGGTIPVNGGVPITVIKATPGSATVNGQELTAVNPIRTVNVAPNQWTLVQATGSAKILVSMGDLGVTHAPFIGHQVPALSGGPAGQDFIFLAPQDGGLVHLCSPTANATVRLVDAMRPSQQLDPDGPVQTTEPLKVAGSPVCRQMRASATWPANGRLEAYTVKGEDDAAAQPIRVLVGSETRQLSHHARGTLGYYGGPGGTSFSTTGQFGVFGHFNDTRITLFIERERSGVRFVTNETFALSADGFRGITPEMFADATGRFSLTSNKPIQVVSLENANHPYGIFVPGRPEPPLATLGSAEFRGPLLELRSREKDGRQDFRSTGPGSPVTFPLELLNLGRWMNGETLPDTVTLTCTALAGWTVEGCDRQVNLAGGTAERVDVVVTPPADALNVNGTITVEARSRHGNIVSSMKLLVFVEIRYGVAMWFDVEGGRKTIDPPIGVDPGDTYRYNILVKNTGSAADSFDLAVEPEARPGWTQRLLLDGDPVTRITLEGGESRILHFAVTAPPNEGAQPNFVQVRAQSVASALAADKVETATRIRPKVSISMTLDPQTRVAEPNETAVFNVTLSNSGNAIFNVRLRQEGLLPSGWNASFNLEPAEVNLNPNPGDDPALTYTFQYRVTPPLGARAGDLATTKLVAEVAEGSLTIPGDQASAVVVVRKVHNVTTPALLDARAEPGETLRYVLPVSNQGNGNDFIELLAGAVEASLVAEGTPRAPGWRVQSDEETLYLDYNESADLPLRVSVPAGAPAGLYNLTFTLRLSREAFQNLTIPILVDRTPRVTFLGETAHDLPPGRPREIHLVAQNTGNVPGAYAFSAEAAQGWNVTFRPASAQLAPGASMPVVAVVNASRDAADGEHEVALLASFEGADAGRTPLALRLARPELTLERVEARGSTSPGELVLVEAVVRNSGGIAADNVTVVLLVEGRAVDQVLLSRIPIGQSSTATLSWVSTKRTSDLRVVIDPAREIVQLTDADDDESPVVFAGRLVPAPAWLVVAALALVSLAPRARRRDGPPKKGGGT